MLRLFIALKLDTSIVEQLQNICFGIKNARWLPSDQIHVTVRFIGNCDESQFYAIQSALDSISLPAFDLAIKGVGHFPPRGNPRILWAGIQHSEGLLNLHHAVNKCLNNLDIEADRKKFHPHITLARFKGRTSPAAIIPFLTQNNLFRIKPFIVTEFHLYSSILRREGAIHRIEESYNLL